MIRKCNNLWKTIHGISFRKCSSNYGPSSLLDHLKQRIKATGPITVASYMKEALTNPIWGYYMQKDVFGKKGDFITSPEISQLFGELVGIWFLSQWLSMNQPKPIQLVELGPGRGTLMADIIRVFQQLGKEDVGKYIDIHFVEVSEKMKDLQMKTFNILQRKQNEGVSSSGINIQWHSHIQDVPKGLSFYVAHEFFDALPVHLFRKVNNQWRELLVNYSNEHDQLEYVLTPCATPVSQSFVSPFSTVSECEVCPDSGVVMETISENIVKHGGLGLIVDYGENSSDRHSIRGFKDHELKDDILNNPGTMDITANVDFGFLKRFSKGYCHGPITQQTFLIRMGIKERIQSLLKSATQEQAKTLLSSYEYLVSTKMMGEKFKVMAVTQNNKSKLPGF